MVGLFVCRARGLERRVEMAEEGRINSEKREQKLGAVDGRSASDGRDWYKKR